MITYEALFLPGRRLLWDGFCSSRFGRADEGGVSNLSVLLWWKYKPEVPILPSAKVALDQHLVQRQELMDLFDCLLIVISYVLG